MTTDPEAAVKLRSLAGWLEAEKVHRADELGKFLRSLAAQLEGGTWRLRTERPREGAKLLIIADGALCQGSFGEEWYGVPTGVPTWIDLIGYPISNVTHWMYAPELPK